MLDIRALNFNLLASGYSQLKGPYFNLAPDGRPALRHQLANNLKGCLWQQLLVDKIVKPMNTAKSLRFEGVQLPLP